MKRTTSLLASAALALLTGSVVAQDFSAFEYRNIGPSRGGRVTAVAGTVAAPSTFYLGASGGGVWKTTDYGTSWHNVSDGYFETPSVGDIAVAQNDANIIYVGTGSDGLRSNVIVGKGMYKSIDGGDTWDHVGLRETGHIGAVEIDPTDNNIVWVAAIGQAFNSNEERGVYKTADGGQTWERVLFISDTVGFSDIELLPGNPNVVFATAWKAERKPWTIISGGEQEEGGLYKLASPIRASSTRSSKRLTMRVGSSSRSIRASPSNRSPANRQFERGLSTTQTWTSTRKTRMSCTAWRRET
jgi:hypothetical protein